MLMEEQNDLLGQLNEGIILVKNESISYMNEISKSIISRLANKPSLEDFDILDIPILKVFRKNESSDTNSTEFIRLKKEKFYTFRQLLATTQDFLDDKLFEIDINQLEAN